MSRLLVFFVLLGLVNGNRDKSRHFRRLDQIILETDCSIAGGVCVIEDDCPPGHLTEKRGLCPKQQKMNVECCYGLSMKETRCSKRGGICVRNNVCTPSLVFQDATDCEKDQICCILTK